MAEQADAMVSKTIGGQPSCRFDPDLRQYGQTDEQFALRLPSCVVVAQRTLNPFAQVRALARQPNNPASKSTIMSSSLVDLVSENVNKNLKVVNKNAIHDYEIFKSLKQDLSQGTLGFYDDKILPFIKDYSDLNKVTPVDVTNWIASRKTFNKKTGQVERTNNLV